MRIADYKRFLQIFDIKYPGHALALHQHRGMVGYRWRNMCLPPLPLLLFPGHKPRFPVDFPAGGL